MMEPSLEALSDEELLLRADDVVAKGFHLTAQLLLVLIRIDDRRLHLHDAYPSLFDFCTGRLRLSEGAAYRRITAVRVVRECPGLIPYIERGEIQLSRIVQLRKHLTPENVDELVAATRGKSKYQVAELVAGRAPRPDVPGTLRKLPTVRTKSQVAAVVDPPIEARAESRYRMQVTVSREVRDKIERLRDLTTHTNPTRDLATLIESAVDALLEKVEKQRLAKTSRPKPAPEPKQEVEAETKVEKPVPATTRGRPTNAVRRRVFARDGEQCTFVAQSGRRCASRRFLELDHIIPRAKGGTDDEDNLRVRCRAHNALYAEEAFGKDFVRSRIDSRRRQSTAKTSAKQKGGRAA